MSGEEMRKVIVGAFLSLNGIMQSPGGPSEDPVGGFKNGGWVVPYFDKTVSDAVSKCLKIPSTFYWAARHTKSLRRIGLVWVPMTPSARLF
jgi:hypothetical protein